MQSITCFFIHESQLRRPSMHAQNCVGGENGELAWPGSRQSSRLTWFHTGFNSPFTTSVFFFWPETKDNDYYTHRTKYACLTHTTMTKLIFWLELKANRRNKKGKRLDRGTCLPWNSTVAYGSHFPNFSGFGMSVAQSTWTCRDMITFAVRQLHATSPCSRLLWYRFFLRCNQRSFLHRHTPVVHRWDCGRQGTVLQYFSRLK